MQYKEIDDQEVCVDMTGIQVERPNSNKAYELFGGAASLSCGTDMDALFLHKDPDPMPKLNTNQEDRANSRCHGNIVCPGDIALVVTGASFTTTGEMKNSQFSFSGSQPLYMNPPPPTASHPFPHPLVTAAPILCRQNPHVYLPARSKKPQMQTWGSCL